MHCICVNIFAEIANSAWYIILFVLVFVLVLVAAEEHLHIFANTGKENSLVDVCAYMKRRGRWLKEVLIKSNSLIQEKYFI